eukprot:590133-Alexandrium_andersonii.AAC.1
MSEPGYMFPWDWTVLHYEDDEGQSIIPGREQFLARGSDHRPVTLEERDEWERPTSQGNFWEG